MRKYVVGFAYWNDCVLLIHKQKGPPYVIGTWNGIGGKIEGSESAQEAMSREFREETGIDTYEDSWSHFATMTGPDYVLECLSCNLDDETDHSDVVNPEDSGEEIGWFHLDYLDFDMKEGNRLTPNLSWLIPLSLDKTTPYLKIEEESNVSA